MIVRNRMMLLPLLVAAAVLSFTSVGIGSDSDDLVTVFFEDFSGQGANSAKQPEKWVNPKWDMPKSADGKWWVIGTGWYGPNKNKMIARQGLMGNLGISRRSWARTSDFRIAPDPVTDAWVLTFKVLGISYTKGAMNVRLIDEKGNGYGCMLAMRSPSSEKYKWTNRVVRWDAGRKNETVLAKAEGDQAHIARIKDGLLHSVELRLEKTGVLTLSVDDSVIARAEDTSHKQFTELNFSIEYETRFTIDDIKLATPFELEEE